MTLFIKNDTPAILRNFQWRPSFGEILFYHIINTKTTFSQDDE